MGSAEAPYPLLFSPLQVGPVRLRNRVVLTPMTTGFGFEQGVADEAMAAYLRERSRNLGMAVVAFGAVAPEGRVEEKLPWMWRPEAERGLELLAAAIHEAGTLACLQLGHGGRQVSPSVTGTEPVAPSPVPPPVHVKTPPRELTLGEIEALVEAFGAAAATAARAGFDAVELHAGHGYLPHQFLSAESNLRSDLYGGTTIRQRARFAVEVVRSLRHAAPGLAVFVRLNGDDLTPGGLKPHDAAEAANAVADAGAHAVVVSGGVYGSVPYTIPVLDDAEAQHVEFAGYVRQRVGLPVVSVGGIARPAVAEAALERGLCDAVAVGRALLADPEWAEKAAAGRVADIRPCIGTLDTCAGMLQHGNPISCAVNPEVGRELRQRVARAARPARIVVVGAGPAGLEAACSAAELGHSTILLERGEEPGGALRLVAKTPPLARVARLTGWFERRLLQAGVELRTGVTADAATVAGLEPDLVVVASGARSEPPVLDGYEHLPAWPLEDLLAGLPSSLGTAFSPVRPLVLGDERPALAGVLACARGGVDATLLSRGRPGLDASGLVRRAYVARLERAGIRRLVGRPVALRADGVVWTDGGDEQLAPADALVIADRRRPVAVPGLDGLEAEVVRVGDAREPRDIAAAIAEGRDAVEAFTRARF